METTQEVLFIVVDENDNPVDFDRGTFCKVRSRTKSNKFPLHAYTEFKAKELMRQDRHFRSINKMGKTKFYLMPFKFESYEQ